MIKYIGFILFNFFSYSVSLCILIFGIFIILNQDQSLSYYRLILFGVLPIIFAIIFFLSKREYKVVIIITSFIFILVIILFENYLIRSEKNFHDTNLKLSNMRLNQLCSFHYSSFDELELFPIGGMPNNLTALYNAQSNLFHYFSLDNHGFNNKNNWDEFSKFNYIFLGDSFTYGADVSRDSSFVNLFKEKFKNTLNLGCNGNGPISELAAFREYVKILKPKIIFLNYYRNDLEKDIVRENKSFYNNYYENKNFTQNLLIKNHEIPVVAEYVYEKASNVILEQENIKSKATLEQKKIKNAIQKKDKPNNFFQLITTESFKLNKVRMLLGIRYGFDREHFNQYKKILNEIDTDINEWGGKLVFVYIPAQYQFINIFNFLDSYFYDTNIFNFLDEKNIEYINLLEEFNKYDNPSSFYNGHFTPQGNEIVAKKLIEVVNKIHQN